MLGHYLVCVNRSTDGEGEHTEPIVPQALMNYSHRNLLFLCELFMVNATPSWRPIRSMLMIENLASGINRPRQPVERRYRPPRSAGILTRGGWPHGAAAPGFCESP